MRKKKPKKHVKNARKKLPRLGCNQRAMLLHLRRVEYVSNVHGGAAWPELWNSKAHPKAVLMSLVRRGLAKMTNDSIFPDMEGQAFLITDSGSALVERMK